MKRTTFYYIIIGSIILYGLINYIKSIYVIPNISLDWNVIWLLDLITFILSFIVPLVIGIRVSEKNDIILLIEKFESNSTIDKYILYTDIYNDIVKYTKKFEKFNSGELSKGYLRVKLLKPVLDFFYNEEKETFYESPEKIKPIFEEIISILLTIENKIEKENLDGNELVSKILSIAIFYNFYYNIDELEASIKKLFDFYKEDINSNTPENS